jgi:hypothetical protein
MQFLAFFRFFVVTETGSIGPKRNGTILIDRVILLRR